MFQRLGFLKLTKVQRDGSTTYFEQRDGSTTYFEQRDGSATYFEQRDGSTTYFKQGDGSTTYFEQRDGSTTYFEQRDGSTSYFESVIQDLSMSYECILYISIINKQLNRRYVVQRPSSNSLNSVLGVLKLLSLKVFFSCYKSWTYKSE